MTNTASFITVDEIEKAENAAFDWYTDSAAKKKIEAEFAKFGLAEGSIDGQAYVETVDTLIAIDKMQMCNEGRQFAIRQQLDEQRLLELQVDTNDEEHSTE